jgi:DNA-directed RNA polymerase specialized sigma24 family protein
MIRHKVAYEVRKQQAQRRNYRRQGTVSPEALETAATGPSPDRQVEDREFHEEVRRLLSAEERQLVDLWLQGRSWEEIAAALGSTPQGRRKQLARALKRVVEAFGLDEKRHE